ncbi:ABC transporter permease [Planotetraspora kaengkrachanensis]|uniref:Transport permease protein n=1 Tax=Planotetraspora kaengkrachanensis TaxID=575193 RepID=A0A8J3LWQ3_9ACTN|nr:ABC transporter permease [Planotetraspora kaengkrachanensis]GIG80513.1 ABC transporter [Planotetraspora kaengkrachanensis]
MTTTAFPPLSAAARRRRIGGVVRRDLAALRRSPVRIFEIVFWPTVELVVWGFVTVYLRAGDVPFIVSTLLGAVLLWQILHRASNEVSMGFLEDIWSRNLLNMHVTPLTAAEYLSGLVVFSLTKVVFSVAVMGTLAYVLYGFGILTVGVALVPFMAVLLVLGWALAIAAISCVLRFGEGAQVIAWSLVFVFQPIAGVFYPVSVLPSGLQVVASFVPATHVFQGMRDVLAGSPIPWDRMAAAAALDVVYVALALALYTVTLRHARAKGRLSRFGE